MSNYNTTLTFLALVLMFCMYQRLEIGALTTQNITLKQSHASTVSNNKIKMITLKANCDLYKETK